MQPVTPAGTAVPVRTGKAIAVAVVLLRRAPVPVNSAVADRPSGPARFNP